MYTHPDFVQPDCHFVHSTLVGEESLATYVQLQVELIIIDLQYDKERLYTLCHLNIIAILWRHAHGICISPLIVHACTHTQTVHMHTHIHTQTCTCVHTHTHLWWSIARYVIQWGCFGRTASTQSGGILLTLLISKAPSKSHSFTATLCLWS